MTDKKFGGSVQWTLVLGKDNAHMLMSEVFNSSIKCEYIDSM